MNPIFTWIIAHTTGKALARRCPKCRHQQLAPREKANTAIPCRRCGALIPPNPR